MPIFRREDNLLLANTDSGVVRSHAYQRNGTNPPLTNAGYRQSSGHALRSGSSGILGRFVWQRLHPSRSWRLAPATVPVLSFKLTVQAPPVYLLT